MRESLRDFPDQTRARIEALAVLLDDTEAWRLAPTSLVDATALAHRLAGSAATMGYPDAGRLAAALEILLVEVAEQPTAANPAVVSDQIALLLRRLRTAGARMTAEGSTVLSAMTETGSGEPDPAAPPTLLLVGALPEDPWASSMRGLEAYGWRVAKQPDAIALEATDEKAAAAPDAVVIDRDTVPEGLALGRRWCSRGGPWAGVPWYLAQAEPGMEARMEAAASGCAGVLGKPVSAETLVDHVAAVQAARTEETARAVLLDGDPVLAPVTRFLLDSAGLTVETVSAPGAVLRALSDGAVDVLVLVERAGGRGAADLATAIRQDPTFDGPGLVLVLPEADTDPVVLALARGGDLVLEGPVDPDLMPAMVAGQASRALGRRRRAACEGRGPVLLAAGLAARLERALGRARALHLPLTVGWMSLEEAGAAGADAESILVRRLGQTLRASDVLGRGPAAGLAAVLPSSGEDAARARLRPALEAMSCLSPGCGLVLGLAVPATPDETAAALLARARRAAAPI